MPVADQNVHSAQIVHQIKLVLTSIALIHVLERAVKVLNVMSQIIYQSVVAKKDILAIHLFPVEEKYKISQLTHVIHLHVDQMLTVTTENVDVKQIIEEIHLMVADRNVH